MHLNLLTTRTRKNSPKGNVDVFPGQITAAANQTQTKRSMVFWLYGNIQGVSATLINDAYKDIWAVEISHIYEEYLMMHNKLIATHCHDI